MLKFYGKHDMVAEKVHDVISFKQGLRLKPYIDFNTKKKAVAKKTLIKTYLNLQEFSFMAKQWKTFEIS